MEERHSLGHIESIGRHRSEISGLGMFNVVRDDEIYYPAPLATRARTKNILSFELRDFRCVGEGKSEYMLNEKGISL